MLIAPKCLCGSERESVCERERDKETEEKREGSCGGEHPPPWNVWLLETFIIGTFSSPRSLSTNLIDKREFAQGDL